MTTGLQTAYKAMYATRGSTHRRGPSRPGEDRRQGPLPGRQWGNLPPRSW